MSAEMETEPRNERVEEEYFICNKEGGCGVTSGLPRFLYTFWVPSQYLHQVFS